MLLKKSMSKQHLESQSIKNNYLNKPWAILGNGSISKLLYNLMIKEGYQVNFFKGFIVTNQYSEKDNYSFKVYSDNSDLFSDEISNNLRELSNLEIYSSIGYSNMNKARKNAFEDLKNYLPYSVIKTFISKEAYICDEVEIEEGCLILPKSIIEASVKIKKGTILWFGCHICHHTIISEFCWIAAQTTIGAKCIIGERSFFAVGAIVPTGSTLEKGTLITAGSVSPKSTNENQVIDKKYFLKENKFQEFDSNDFIRFL